MVLLLRGFAACPLWFLHGLGFLLGWLTYAVSPAYRRRLKEHARQAGIARSAQREAVGGAGRMVAELPWLWLSPPERRLSEWVQWQGLDKLHQAVESGRGVVLLTPHLGSFEVCAQAYAQTLGNRSPLTALYRPARKPWLRALEEESRDRPGLKTAPASLSGVRQMIRALRRGETVGLLPDQVPPEGLGVWASFFGRPAYTMTLASRLVEQTGSALLLMWCERRPQGLGWVLHVLHPQELGVQPEPVNPEMINRCMEALILQAPQQYLWGYHRYKQPRRLDSTAEAVS